MSWASYMQFLESKGETGVTCTKVETVEELLQEADVSARAQKHFMLCNCPGSCFHPLHLWLSKSWGMEQHGSHVQPA